MSKSSFFFLLSLAALSLGLSVPAGAVTITVSSSLPAGYTPSVTFGANDAVYGNVSAYFYDGFGTAGTSNTSLANYYLDPLPSAGYYAYVEDGGLVGFSFTFPTGITSFSLLWGSPDSTNYIAFATPDNAIFASYTAADLAAYGLLVNSQTSQFVTFTGLGDVIQIYLGSLQNSFEFGDVSAVAATPSPEPASVGLIAAGALLAAGFGAVCGRRR